VVERQRHHGKQRARHPGRHGQDVDREAADEGALAADEAQALRDRTQHRLVALHADRRLS
jgi:hypothetical protein